MFIINNTLMLKTIQSTIVLHFIHDVSLILIKRLPCYFCIVASLLLNVNQVDCWVDANCR
jgi:hypothetical protein